ncbi:MAG: hypothetical protein J5994_09680 [Ruminococcus sp.]|nr:hypothetical protein [Ruminococcus sp.]
MTLLITFIAAISATVIWYFSSEARELDIGILCYMYWGASLMWLVDAAFEYSEKGAEFFAPSASQMINDTYLGLCVTVLGLIIWTAVLLIKDPKGTVRNALSRK